MHDRRRRYISRLPKTRTTVQKTKNDSLPYRKSAEVSYRISVMWNANDIVCRLSSTSETICATICRHKWLAPTDCVSRFHHLISVACACLSSRLVSSSGHTRLPVSGFSSVTLQGVSRQFFSTFCPLLDNFTPRFVLSRLRTVESRLDLGLNIHSSPCSLPQIMCLWLHPRLPSDENVRDIRKCQKLLRDKICLLSALSPITHGSSSSSPSSLSLLASSRTRSVFHSELKTWIFGKSFPP